MSEPQVIPADEALIGSVVDIKAQIECGGCGTRFYVTLDHSPSPTGWGPFEEAIDAIRSGQWEYVDRKKDSSGFCSVQAGYLLCGECTKKVDDYVAADRDATDKEVRKALKNVEYESAEDDDGGDDWEDEK